MSRLFSTLSFLAVLVLLQGAAAMAPTCDDMCNFRLCKAITGFPLAPIGRKLLLRDPGVSTYPVVCLPGATDLGDIVKTGEARVRLASSSGAFTSISRYGTGVRPSFSKKFFQLSEISAFPPIPGKYGLSRTKAKGNQWNVLDNLCVILPITRYRRGGRLIKTRDPKSCVSFTTVKPIILVEMTWNTGDDLDLRVTEPNGNIIFFGNKVSSTGGRLLFDRNVGLCGTNVFGREQVRWLMDSSPLTGKYKVEVRHWSGCPPPNPKPTWSLSVIVNGKLKVSSSGTATTNGGDAIIDMQMFKIKPKDLGL